MMDMGHCALTVPMVRALVLLLVTRVQGLVVPQLIARRIGWESLIRVILSIMEMEVSKLTQRGHGATGSQTAIQHNAQPTTATLEDLLILRQLHKSMPTMACSSRAIWLVHE